MTYDIKYMANTTLDKFNRAFAFSWQDEVDARPVRSGKHLLIKYFRSQWLMIWRRAIWC